MKTTTGIILFAVILPFIFSFTDGDGKRKNKTSDKFSENTNVALVIIGHVANTSFDFRRAKYRLYRDNSFAGSGITDRYGTMELHLMRNSRYLLEISAHGFISKKIYINTMVPENFKNVLDFDFELELFPNDDNNSAVSCALDVPFAVVYFNPQLLEFDYDKLYTEEMMRLEERIIN